VCDFFVSNIYVSRVDVADKETVERAWADTHTGRPQEVLEEENMERLTP
jgi:hypothetical protein